VYHSLTKNQKQQSVDRKNHAHLSIQMLCRHHANILMHSQRKAKPMPSFMQAEQAGVTGVSENNAQNALVEWDYEKWVDEVIGFRTSSGIEDA